MRGIKKYEFRRKIFRNNIERVYIYSTFPARQVIGFFLVEEILNDTPEVIWERCRNESGVTAAEFFEYFRNSKIAFAIKIGKISQLKKPIEIEKINLTAPQSFCYLREDKENLLVNSVI